MKKILSIIFIGFVVIFTSCDLDVQNENQPDVDRVETFSLLLNGYNTWYNGSIAASPSIGFACAELIQAGTISWGSGTMWFQPRQSMFNDDTPDPVIIINFGAWYNYYGSIGIMMKVSRELKSGQMHSIIGGKDYKQRSLAHAYIIQALLYGNIALLYDKAYLYKEEHDPYTFDYVANTKSYKEVMAFALSKLDEAIKIIEEDDLNEDPEILIPGPNKKFKKTSLLEFANSMAARFMVCLPRTQQEAAQVDWNKVKAYAEKGLSKDFAVAYNEGWRGKVMTRDEGNNYFSLINAQYMRVSNWLLNKMAPNDPASVYPIPINEGSDDYLTWPEIKNCPDERLEKYFKYDSMKNWFAATRYTWPGYGTFMLSQYRYWRYYEVVDDGMGNVDHFLKMENDTYLAEALIRTKGDKARIAELINETRVKIGKLPPAQATESYEDLEDKLFYERYVECDLVWPHLGYFDRRRNKDQMIPGTPRHFPIPGPELNMHGQELYTFGGIGKEM